VSEHSVIVVIGRPEIASPVRKRFAQNRNVTVFRDSEAISALQTIVMQPPKVVALDPLFAATSRGAMLIAQIKADSALALIDIRLLTIDSRADFVQSLRDADPSPEVAICALSRPLDWCGTRRAQRFTIAPDAPAAVNGQPSQIVNLSATGVQLVSSSRLHPSQGFRLTLSAEDRETRLNAVVAWSTFEGLGESAAYRAGATFVDSDVAMIEEYCRRYGTSIDKVFVVPNDCSAASAEEGLAPATEPKRPKAVDPAHPPKRARFKRHSSRTPDRPV
jgi:hypothetical protein